MRKIPLDQARRIALGAQGFDRPRPTSAVDIRHIRRVIHQLGLLQLDFVNVLVPAHYLVLFSRLGAYDRDGLHRLVYRQREFTEQWAHEASIVPMELWPLLEYRRRDYRPWPNSPIARFKQKSRYMSQVYDFIRENGAATSQAVPPAPRPVRRPGDWYRSLSRWALEWHFGNGDLAVADRLPNFQRTYDLPEKVIDARHLERGVSRADAQRELLRRAARACGIATVQDLSDYYRMSPREAAPLVEELVESGDLRPVAVDGWKNPAYLAKGARTPRTISCSTLLSPFDPLVWFRPRTERLFDFHYRIEIYVPAAKRKWGYYVLPYLLGDRIVARVDLKAERKKCELRVLAAHKEGGVDEESAAAGLATELQALASWLDLERVRVSRRGRFARMLADCISSNTRR